MMVIIIIVYSQLHQTFTRIVGGPPDINDVDCPQCASILAGSVLHKRFLLLGHELLFAGAEVWLRDLGEMLESSGATVRFLFLCKKGNLLKSHDELGLSYLFWEKHNNVQFEDFDYIIANTAAVEKWSHFYETTSAYKSGSEMERIYRKSIMCIHEYKPEQYINEFFKLMLPKMPKIIFDLDAGRSQWVNMMPEIANQSITLHPGITKSKMLDLMSVSDEKTELRQRLEIPATKSDVVILQVSSVTKHKGILELIDGFNTMFQSLPTDEMQEKSWFLVLVGEPGRASFKNRIRNKIDYINTSLKEKNSASRIILRPATSDVVSYYKAADIFILNSYCENFGLVTVEAMLAGLPTISRDCGGAREIINDGVTGRLLPNKESNQIEVSQVLVEMTTGSGWTNKLNKMGLAGMRRAKDEFSYMRMAREFINIIAEQRYFARDDPLWTCTSQEEKDGTIVMHRSHSNAENNPAAPMLPNIKSFDIGCGNVGTNLFTFGGYQDQNHVTKTMQYYNMKENIWVDAPQLPEKAAESHQAITQDDRYIYSLSGQLGPQCQPPVKQSFAYDSLEKKWLEIPELPVAWYGGCAAILHGRLHFVGGFDKDRRTPRPDHYSMDINELYSWLLDMTVEAPAWQKELDIPSSSGHVLCNALTTAQGPKLYFFGGEANDYYPKNPSRGNHRCVPGLEFNRPFVHIYDGKSWERGPDLPYPLSHAEGSRVVSADGDGLFFFGGSSVHEQELKPDIPILTDGILYFSADKNEFRRVGNMYPIGVGRKAACGIGNVDKSGNITMFVVGGQRSQSTTQPWAKDINKFAMLCTSSISNLQ